MYNLGRILYMSGRNWYSKFISFCYEFFFSLSGAHKLCKILQFHRFSRKFETRSSGLDRRERRTGKREKHLRTSSELSYLIDDSRRACVSRENSGKGGVEEEGIWVDPSVRPSQPLSDSNVLAMSSSVFYSTDNFLRIAWEKARRILL